MKRNFTSIACGIAAASILSLALTACDNDSPSAPTGGDENSSALEKTDDSSSSKGEPASSETSAKSSETGNESSSSEGATVTCDALSPECGYTEEELCNMGQMRYCKIVPASSSSAEKLCEAFLPECGYSEEELCGMGYTEYCASSSSTFEKCIDMDQMCPPCVKIDGEPACPVTNVACNACTTEGATAPNCKGGLGYVCSDGLWKQIKGEPICDPGDDCDGDGIPDGIRRPDLEPCDTEGSTLEFYNRYFVCHETAWNRIDKQACEENGSTKVVGDFGFQCVSGKWEYLPPPITYINENATDVSAMGRGGPAVSPRVVKVQSASGSVTFRDDGVLVDNNCTFNGLNAELRGDTLFATILYPGCTTNGGFMGVITFTLGIDFADVKYIKYSDRDNVKPVSEETELLPCGNTSSCNTCGGDRDSLRVGC